MLSQSTIRWPSHWLIHAQPLLAQLAPSHQPAKTSIRLAMTMADHKWLTKNSDGSATLAEPEMWSAMADEIIFCSVRFSSVIMAEPHLAEPHLLAGLDGQPLATVPQPLCDCHICHM